MFWIPLIVFFLHMIEELPKFPAWASKYFGSTSQAWYVYSHIPLSAFGIGVGMWANSAQPQSWGIIIGMAMMFTLVLNGMFHLATTIVFREYSPGVITGIGLFVPAAWYMVNRVQTDALLSTESLWIASVIGVILQLLIIASLYLPMNIDWRFRRVDKKA